VDDRGSCVNDEARWERDEGSAIVLSGSSEPDQTARQASEMPVVEQRGSLQAHALG
jgi:hypothetical protein